MVNFTTLGEGIPAFNQRSTPSIALAIGMSSQSTIKAVDIMEATAPFPLIAGVNLVAAVTLGIRQTFKNPMLSSFGLFESSNVFWTSQLMAVYPDPSPIITRAEDISTIRLFLQDDASAYRIVSDYRASSVLSGFSAVGGLWTTLSGVFAILFGGSLLRLLTGTKALSVFGMAHSLAHFQSMKDSLIKHYPKILDKEADENRGLLAFLRDHLLNLKFLEIEEDLNNSPQLQLDMEGGFQDKDADGEEKGTSF